MMRQGKSHRLARRWPLLSPHQDPASLQSRVAFHLHRLGMTGARLRQAGLDLRTASALTQGRSELNNSDVTRLAVTLGIPSGELARDLSDQEQGELAFYRYSSENMQAIWNVVLLAFPKLSDEHIADLTGINHRRISSARLGKPERLLTWEEAQRVAEIAGANAIDLFSIEDMHSR